MSQSPHKKPAVGQTCNARAEAETGRPLGLAGRLAFSIRIPSANMLSHTDTSTHKHTNGNKNKAEGLGKHLAILWASVRSGNKANCQPRAQKAEAGVQRVETSLGYIVRPVSLKTKTPTTNSHTPR